jgi:hypothetical protein
MRTAGIFVIMICAGLLVHRNFPSTQPTPVVPALAIPADLQTELTAAFAGKKADAAVWSGMFDGLARYIEADGKTAKPLIVTTFDLQKLRDGMVAAPLHGVAGGAEIGKLLGPHLEAIGKAGEPLDKDGRREKVVALFAGCSQVLGQK